jgi:hypothetical protein
MGTMCSQNIYVFRYSRYINEKKRVLDQSNSKVWVQFVPNAGKKNPVAKGLTVLYGTVVHPRPTKGMAVAIMVI